MDSKEVPSPVSPQDHHQQGEAPAQRRLPLFRRIIVAILVGLGVYSLLAQFETTQYCLEPVPDYWMESDIVPMHNLVPLEAHIISKCPDTRDAMKQLILPVMQQVSDKVDFKLSYIGKITADEGVDCMHGPEECLGNILELCAREIYPDPKINLGFIMCLTRDYKHIPERTLVEDCALEHAIDIQALNECATKEDGEYGMRLLRDSVRRTASVDVTTSCTIRLNDEVYCIRDGGEWSNCPNGAGVNDLIIAIEKAYYRS